MSDEPAARRTTRDRATPRAEPRTRPERAAPSARRERAATTRTTRPLVGSPTSATPPTGALTSKPSWRAQRAARRMRARKVTRVIRHVEPFSVLKAALIFFFCLWTIFLVTGALLWRVAVSTGVIDNIESFIRDLFAEKTFQLDGSQLFRAYAVGGLVMVLVSTGFAVLFAILFNLISDLVGGIRVSVIQEETARETDY